MKMKIHLQTLCLILLPFCANAIEYEVYFNFDKDSKKQENFLKKKSELYLASKDTYNSIFAIRNQAEDDAKILEEALKSQGYLDALVFVHVDKSQKIPSIIFEISSGARYKIGSFMIRPTIHELEDIEPLTGYISYELINNCEKTILETLQNSGFYKATIVDTKIVTKSENLADVIIQIEPGDLYHFGHVSIEGLKKVNPSLIENKISWKKGDVFSAKQLRLLQKSLLDSQVFSQVTIKTLEPENTSVPISIEVQESKFKSVGIGVNYQTHFGFGGDLSFEHKNLASKGQRLNFETTVTQNSLLGQVRYAIPDFYKENQSLDFKIEASREQLNPSFSDNLYEALGKFNKINSPQVNFDVGLAARYYIVQHSVQNGHHGVGLSFFKWRYDNTYSELLPKNGVKLTLGGLIYQNLNHAKTYFSGTFKSAFFYSFLKKRFTIAEQIYYGSFYKASLSDIPVPLRFFGGTDEYLRGFKYYTVAPLLDHKPEGGLSCLFFNSELRIVLKYPFGTVFFYDSGFVSSSRLPFNQSPYYQSVGFGFRYYAFFGPLRIDMGFPIDRRKKLDSKFKILATFGHTF
jgi:translocation and assembly module TamA